MKYINILHKYYLYALVILWGAVCFLFFQLCYPYHFFFEEQSQLFLINKEYLLSYFSKPAALSCLIGDFLTQFYYYLYAGAAILTITILTEGDLMRRALQQAGLKKYISFLVAIITMTILACFSLRTEYHLSSIISVIGGTMTFLLCNSLKVFRYKWVIYLCLSYITFLLFGNGWIIFMVLEFVYNMAKHQWKEAVAYICLISMTTSVSAMLYRNKLCMNTADMLIYPNIGKFTKPDFILERDFAADNEYYFGNYDKVINMVEKEKDPSDNESFFYNLAAAKLNILPEKLLSEKNPYLGTFLTINEKTLRLQINMINELYWLIGDMTFTERAATMANTFTPGSRNARMIKRLAEVNLVTGEKTAAMKYLRILDNTLIYHKWAEERIKGNNSEYISKRQFTNTQDTLRTNDNCYVILTELLKSNPKNVTALNYLLCSDLLSRRMDLFGHDYLRFGPYPRQLYLQAMDIYNTHQKRTAK